METFFALLTHCGGIHLPPRESLSQMSAIRNFDFVITHNKLLKPATASKDSNL